MARITTLPGEIHNYTVQHLSFRDQLHLSSTCQQLRVLLAPALFRTIRITNDKRVAESALLAVQKYGRYTTWLQFTGQAGGEDEFSPPALVAAASDLLSGKYTPNLRTLQIRFDFNFDSGEVWDDNPDASTDGIGFYVFDADEDESYVQKQEEERKWRALMNESWQAIAGNVTAEKLIIDDLIPKWTSAFRTTQFQQFLGRLESASVSVLGMDNGVGWQTNTLVGYLEFLAELDSVFFDHMGRLKHLVFCASKISPIGLTGYHHAPLALDAGHLPALESLKLQNCFVGPELVAFMQGHTEVLTRVQLEECVSGSDGAGMAEDAIYWNTFFDSLREAKVALSEFVLDFGRRAPLSSYEELYGIIGEDEPENTKEIRKRLADDPRLKVFGSGYLDDKYGTWYMHVEDNIRRFEQGRDQKAYDLLMALVEENAGR